MKIALVIHSATGNTLSVANQMAAKLSKVHEVSLFHIKALDERANPNKVELITTPNIEAFDYVILGAPTRGMDLSPAMKKFLMHLQITKKRASIYVTHFFPFAWLGGTQSIRSFRNLAFPNFIIEKTGIISWKNSHRVESIQLLVDHFTDIE